MIESPAITVTGFLARSLLLLAPECESSPFDDDLVLLELLLLRRGCFLRMALISDQMFFISSVKTEKGTVSWGKRSVSGLSANVKLASFELALCWEGRRIAFSLLLSAPSDLVKKPLKLAACGP